MRGLLAVVLLLVAHAAAFSPAAPHTMRRSTASRGSAPLAKKRDDGPWSDAWAKYVLLRPGMTYSELKAATLQRNKLSAKDRIPGTYRTVILTHAICFIAAIPALLTNEEVFPKLVEAAALSRVTAGFGAPY